MGARRHHLFAIYIVGFCFAGAVSAAPRTVTVRPLAELLTDITHSAPAIVVSLNVSRISAELRAKVIDIPVRVGDVVEAGQPVLRLDCRQAVYALRQAEAELAALAARRRLARLQLERVRTLERSHTVSEEQLNRHQAELEVLTSQSEAQQAAVAAGRDDVAKCVVRSPFRGVVLERLGQLGELAMPGSELMVLMDVESIELSVQVPNSDAASLVRADELVFRHADVGHRLRLRAMAPVIDPATRTREVRLVFDGRLPPVGASGRLVWRDPRSALPPDLMVRRDGRMGVLSVRDNQAVFLPVDGALEGRPAMIDLPENTPIITDGRHGVVSGSTIVVAGS